MNGDGFFGLFHEKPDVLALFLMYDRAKLWSFMVSTFQLNSCKKSQEKLRPFFDLSDSDLPPKLFDFAIFVGHHESPHIIASRNIKEIWSCQISHFYEKQPIASLSTDESQKHYSTLNWLNLPMPKENGHAVMCGS